MDTRPPSEESRRLPIYALLAANAVSMVGNAVTSIAVPWFVLETTGSAVRMGITGAAIGFGTILASFLGGPLVDRLGFKRMSVLADLTSGVTVALVPLFYLAGVLTFWQLLVLVFIGSLLDAPGASARESLIPDLARSAGMPIERANSADAALPRLAQFLGPPIAGILVVVLGASNVLLIDAATFAVSAVLVAAAVPTMARPAEGVGPGEARGYLAELAEGLRFVRGNVMLLSMILIATVANFADDPLTSVILPVFVQRNVGGADTLGLMLGVFGAGALAGTALFGAVGHRLPRRPTFLLCFAVAGPLPYWILAATSSLPVIVGAFLLWGLLAGPINPIYSTVIQEHTPRRMRGRVFGALSALAMAGLPLGGLVGGFLVEGVGLVAAVICFGAFYQAVTLGMVFNPALRGMNK